MLSALFIQPETSSSSSRRSIHSTYSVIVVGLFESIDARVVCDTCDETSDSVFSRFFQYVTDIITPLTGFRRSILPSETQLSSSDSQDSPSMYDIPAGLHHYLRNGGGPRVEIKVDFLKGVVPLSTLLDPIWVILCRQYNVFPIFLCHVFC